MENNFDTNSKGISISSNIFFDNSMAASDFKENSAETKEKDVYVYIDLGNIEKPTTKELITIKKNNKKEELLKALNYFSDEYFGNELNKDEIIENIYNLEIGKIYSPDWLSGNGIEDYINITNKFEIVSVNGYSQGDVMEYIVPHSLAEVWGTPKSKMMNGLKETLTHIAFDSTISGEININDKEYYVSDYLDDPYTWEKENFLESFFEKNEFDELTKNEIEETIPEILEYI